MNNTEPKPLTVADTLREFTGTSLQMVLTVPSYIELLEKAARLHGRIRYTAAESIDSVVHELPQQMLVDAERRMTVQLQILQSIRARVAKQIKEIRRFDKAQGR